MELNRSGGVMLFILNCIISRTRNRSWVSKKWVEKKTLEDLFDELNLRGIEVYTHFEFDNPWETFDDDLAACAEAGWIEVESFLVQVEKEHDQKKFTLEERAFISLTKKGRVMIQNSQLYFAEHQKIIEEVINDIVLHKN